MNIVESLRKIENQLFYKTGETHNLVGAYLAEDVDKEKVWEMLKSNNIKGIINLLEQAWYDDEWDDRDFATVDKPRNKREQMEYIEKYCDMVDGELVSVNGKPKIVYPDGELIAGSLSELVDMIHKELNEDYEPEWHDTADQEQLDQPDYTPEYVDDDIDCEWWCGLDEKLSEKEMDKYRDLEVEYRKLPNQWGGKAKAIMKMMAKLANKMDDDQMRKFVSNKMAMAESLEDLNVLTDDELEQYRITDSDRDYAGTMLWEDVFYIEDLFPGISVEDAGIISDYVEHLDAHLYLTDDGVIIVQPLAFDAFGYRDLESFLKDVKYTISQWDDENFDIDESLNESDEKRFNSSREVMEFFYELASMSDNPEDAIKKFVDEHKSDPHVEDAYDEWCDMEPY